MSLDEQAALASKHVAGLSEQQARFILETARGAKRPFSVVIGGSRVRGDFHAASDIDIGFGHLTKSQATKRITKIRHQARENGGLLPETFQIVPGRSVDGHAPISSPEEFFQRSGVQTAGDKAGQPFGPSGSITFDIDGTVTIRGGPQ